MSRLRRLKASDPANYRPVSLTSVFGKIMERVIAADMIDYLLRNNLLNTSQHQHGFLSKRSTLTNLLESFGDWTISIENKLPNRVAYIDFSRAFDSVSHPKLLHKLKSYGIDGILLDWVASFFCLGAHTVPRWGMFIHRFSVSTVVWFKAVALVRYCF